MLQVGYFYMYGGLPSEATPETVLVVQSAARVGYVTRCVEYDSFAHARDSNSWLHDMLVGWLADPDFGGDSESETLIEGASRMALTEPLDGGHDDSASLWLIPGLGGALRHQLAGYLLAGIGTPDADGLPTLPDDVSSEAIHRTWMYGFFLRALTEQIAADAA